MNTFDRQRKTRWYNNNNNVDDDDDEQCSRKVPNIIKMSYIH